MSYYSKISRFEEEFEYYLMRSRPRANLFDLGHNYYHRAARTPRVEEVFEEAWPTRKNSFSTRESSLNKSLNKSTSFFSTPNIQELDYGTVFPQYDRNNYPNSRKAISIREIPTTYQPRARSVSPACHYRKDPGYRNRVSFEDELSDSPDRVLSILRTKNPRLDPDATARLFQAERANTDYDYRRSYIPKSRPIYRSHNDHDYHGLYSVENPYYRAPTRYSNALELEDKKYLNSIDFAEDRAVLSRPRYSCYDCYDGLLDGTCSTCGTHGRFGSYRTRPEIADSARWESDVSRYFG